MTRLAEHKKRWLDNDQLDEELRHERSKLKAAKDFDETKHPRDQSGKFTDKGKGAPSAASLTEGALDQAARLAGLMTDENRERLTILDLKTGKLLAEGPPGEEATTKARLEGIVDAPESDETLRLKIYTDDQSLLSLHSHPDSTAFSAGDWGVFMGTAFGMNVVVGPDGAGYVATKPDDFRAPTPRKVREKYDEIQEEVFEEMVGSDDFDAGKVIEETNRRLADHLGIEFSTFTSEGRRPAPSAPDVTGYMTAMVKARAMHEVAATKKWAYHGTEDFVLKEGRAYHPQELPEKYPRGTIKECFHNAAMLAIEHPELTYVEGYAKGAIIPVHHAWCVDDKGNVIDNTWPDPGEEYVGVPFRTKWLTRYIVKNKTYGVLGAYWANFPIETGADDSWKGEDEKQEHLRARFEKEWDESKHPRDEGGQFTDKGGGDLLPGPPKAEELWTDKERSLPWEARQAYSSLDEMLDDVPAVQEEMTKVLNKGEGLDVGIKAKTLDVEGMSKEERDQAIRDAMTKGKGPVILIAQPKTRESATDKVQRRYGGRHTAIHDLVRATVAVDTPDEFSEVMQGLRAEMDKRGWVLVSRPESRWDHPAEGGYRDLIFKIGRPGKLPVEVQVNTKAMLTAKVAGHDLYVEARNIKRTASAEKRDLTDEEKAEVDALESRMSEIYEEAARASE
jgi:hypothetical protein